MIAFITPSLMPLTAVTTFGINAKPDSTNPIGFFGTGLKYAIAVCLRLGGEFQLFIGETEYVFYVKDEDFRGKEFGMIRMKKRKGLLPWSYDRLPFTTELGKTWEAWMAVRELETNTRDENGYSDTYDEDWVVETDREKTIIVITCPEMEEAYEQVGSIFMQDLDLIHEDGTVQIFDGKSNYIYYRGMRVTDLDRPSAFTYNFTSLLGLTEDRTSKYHHYDRGVIKSAIMSCPDKDFVDMVIGLDDKSFEGTLDFDQSAHLVSSPTFYAAVSERISTGGVINPRIKTYHQSLNKTNDDDTEVSIEMSAGDWKKLHKRIGDEEFKRVIYNALVESEVPVKDIEEEIIF